MNELNLDKYLNIANNAKKERGMDNYVPLYPMLRKQDDKLYVGILLSSEDDSVWESDSKTKIKNWILIDIGNDSIVEFNNVDDKDYVNRDIYPKTNEENQKEISKYKVKKILEYKNYLIDDIKNEKIPFQERLSKLLGDKMYINGEYVDINEYLLSNLEDEINGKINELVELLIISKFGSLTAYYDILLKNIIDEYNSNKEIDNDKLKLCVEIMDEYYKGVIGIGNFFNI